VQLVFNLIKIRCLLYFIIWR